MAKTVTRSHDWIKWQLSQVDVIVDPFTHQLVVVDSVDTAVGVQVACQLCSEPLTEASATTQCGAAIELP